MAELNKYESLNRNTALKKADTASLAVPHTDERRRLLRVTLIANAGVLLTYDGVTLMLDGIYGHEGHPFSNLKPEVWDAMLCGRHPFEKVDYLLFSHNHPDHFSPEMAETFLSRRRVKGVFFPEGDAPALEHFRMSLKRSGTPAVALSGGTDHAAFQIEPRICVRALKTLHLDRKFQNIPNYCYLLTFGNKNVLFTADADYIHETFAELADTHLRAVFVNPLFFNALRRGRFFRGHLDAETVCIYHVPFSGEDAMRMRPALAHDLLEWQPEHPETIVLCDAFQHIDL